MKHLFILDVAHGENVPGKRSPDQKHLEYLWSREICNRILLLSKHQDLDVICPFLDIQREPGLTKRVKTYEKIQSDKPKVMLSFHNNAQGSGENWMNARGFSAYTSKGQTKSDKVAEIIIDQFIKNFPEIKTRMEMIDGDKDYEANFTVLMGNYIQVLLEVLFQDNKNDIEILDSESFKVKFANLMISCMLVINNQL